MKNSTVLIVIGKDASKEALGRQLETLRAIPARAAILIIAQIPNFPYYAVGIPPYGSIVLPADWQEEITEQKTALDAREKEIEALLGEHDVSGEVSTVVCEPSMVADAVGRRAMLCDMVVVGDDLRAQGSLYAKVVHGVLFQSPAGVLLNDSDATTLQAPKRILVAWNTHLHSARAVHAALPLLREADEVIIAAVDPVMTEYAEGEDPGVDVARWLTHHGCSVVVQQYPSGGKSVGDCLLDRARETGADLIVMGSYGHSRTREAIFGGTTRTMIEQTGQAVFLAH
jgi:nucleotide-binding universal stress UspA family protein